MSDRVKGGRNRLRAGDVREPVSGFHGLSDGEVVCRRYVPGYIKYEIMDGFMRANDRFSLAFLL